jgi:hypothetical protein
MRSFALGVLLVACTSESPPTPPPNQTPLQMNDLTVLFPLATTAEDFDTYLAASSTGNNGALLPESLFESDQDSAIAYDDLRVIGFRLDPCFANVGPITDPSKCDNQIRLVFQPMSIGLGSNLASAADQAVHVSYSITRDQLIAAANAIAAARALSTTDDLGPLAVNPLVAKQGLSGPYAQALRGIIMTYANSAKIERLTTFFLEAGGFSGGSGGGSAIANGVEMGSGSGSDIVPPPFEADNFWDMHGFSVVADVETPLQIGSLGSGTIDMSISASTEPLEAQLEPVTDGSDNLTLLASASEAGSASSAQRQAAFDAALRIENPNDNSPNTIDCASCHMAEPARMLVGQPMFDMSATGDTNAFVADPSIPSADLASTATTFVDPLDQGLNIHAFSYRNTDPIINQRVINETAANLAYLNSLMQ